MIYVPWIEPSTGNTRLRSCTPVAGAYEVGDLFVDPATGDTRGVVRCGGTCTTVKPFVDPTTGDTRWGEAPLSYCYVNTGSWVLNELPCFVSLEMPASIQGHGWSARYFNVHPFPGGFAGDSNRVLSCGPPTSIGYPGGRRIIWAARVTGVVESEYQAVFLDIEVHPASGLSLGGLYVHTLQSYSTGPPPPGDNVCPSTSALYFDAPVQGYYPTNVLFPFTPGPAGGQTLPSFDGKMCIFTGGGPSVTLHYGSGPQTVLLDQIGASVDLYLPYGPRAYWKSLGCSFGNHYSTTYGNESFFPL